MLPISVALKWTCPANYLFGRLRVDGLFDPLYVGEAENLGDRLHRHEKGTKAHQLGVTHVHVHLLAKTRASRLKIETELRWSLSPPLNEQAVPAYSLANSLVR